MTRIQTQVQPLRFLLKLSALVLLLTIGIGLIFLGLETNGLMVSILGSALLGVMFAHAVELQHQCLHATAFRSPRANLWIGRLLGVPLLVSFSHYRAKHFHHHSKVGTPEDSEFFSYRNEDPSPFLKIMSSWIRQERVRQSLAHGFRAWAGMSPEDIATKRDQKGAILEYGFFLVFVSALIVLGFMNLSWLIFGWILPALVFGEFTHILIELPEHFRVGPPSTDPFVNTRSIRGSWFSFWLTNGNNLHVEHHLYPHLSIDQLPKLHREIHAQIRHLEPSYWSFFWGLIRSSR